MTTSYRIDNATDERIENIFKHHPPFGNQLQRYNTIRESAKGLAFLIASLTPPSIERDRALSHLDEAVTSANSAIARHETEGPTKEQELLRLTTTYGDPVFAGKYGGHDPNELPGLSEEAGGDPIGWPADKPITKPGVEPQYDPLPKRERNVIPA